jgi:hypothetical protein
MREGTTLRVMVADKPSCKFYNFYSVSLEYFGYTLVQCQYHLPHREQSSDKTLSVYNTTALKGGCA